MDQNKLSVKLEVSADLLTWLAVYQNVSLALRHPGQRSRPAAVEMMRSFLEQLGQGLIAEALLTQDELEALELANMPDPPATPPTGRFNA